MLFCSYYAKTFASTIRQGLPTSVATQLTFLRYNLLSHGTIYFVTTQLTLFTAQFTFSRHNLLSHGKSYFFTVHGTIYFLTAVVNFRGGSAGNQGKRTQSPLGRVPRQNSFRFPSWLLIVTVTMKMWCKYELFIFSLSYSNILKGLLLV